MNHRINTTIRGHHFEAEGPTEVIQAQFARFLEVIANEPAPVVSQPQLAAQSLPAPAFGEGGGGAAAGSVQPLHDDVLARVFRREGDELSVLGLPQTKDSEADTLVILLYGFARLCGRSNVTGFALTQAARQSGINLERADRALSRRSDLIMAAGNKRGRRYSLNNRGSVFAERVIREMVE